MVCAYNPLNLLEFHLSLGDRNNHIDPRFVPSAGKKVHVIGQSIDQDRFTYTEKDRSAIRNGIYVGRFDQSKNLNLITELLSDCGQSVSHLTLTFVGQATRKNGKYFQNFLEVNEVWLKNSRLKILEKVPNMELPNILSKYDFFLNAFYGSLDKSLIEATMMGLPTITINPAYIEQFGSWSEITENSETMTLKSEFVSMLKLPPNEIEKVCKQRSELAVRKHSRTSWIQNLVKVLGNAK